MPSLTRPTVRTTVATAAALTCAAVPVFLFGALSEFVRADLGFDAAGVGAGVTAFFVAAALGAYPAGRVTERVGPRAAMTAGAAVASLAGLGIGVLAQRWWHAAGLLVVAGASVGLVDTGGARAFATVIPPQRQGLAFGLKEASVPAASMLAGATVPLLAVTVGWRPSFGVGVLLLPLVWLLLPSSVRADADGSAHQQPTATRSRPPNATLRSLVLVAVGAGAGAGTATAAASFLVPSATAAGLSAAAAGTLLAAGSLLSILARVVTGHLADRRQRGELAVIAALLVLGAAGPLLLAGQGAAVAVTGGLLVLGAGWGWTGLVFLAAIRAQPQAPAAAAGVVLTGLATGGALGPLAFGLLVSARGYPAAWLAAAAAMALGAAATWLAHRRSARTDPTGGGELQRFG